MSFVVAYADTIDNVVSIKRFEARSIKECQDKVMQYIIDQYDWDDNIDFPDEYNEFVEFMKDYNILLSSVTDIELI